MPVRQILTGATDLRPIAQGDLSRLCGLYSVINAVRLSLYPQVLVKGELQEMYLHGVRHLVRRRQLNRVIGVGMHEEVWSSLAEGIATYTNETYGTALKLEPVLFDGSTGHVQRKALALIRKRIRALSPVLTSFGGALNHFTVVSGYTEQRLILFDSSGLHWLRSDNVGIGGGSHHRHWISASGLLAVVDDW